jgi:hypothetical protein
VKVTKAERTARIERIRERIKDLRTPHVGDSDYIIADILELLADLAARAP